jgi:hypothetical protein
MQSNHSNSDKSTTNKSTESNKTIDFLHYDDAESIGSSHNNRILAIYTNTNTYLNEALLSQSSDHSLDKINKIIGYLLCLIVCAIIAAIILFAIYQFTNGHALLYKYAFGCFIIALFVSLCLCTCMIYRWEIVNIEMNNNNYASV